MTRHGTDEREAGRAKDERRPSREAAREERHGPDWEPSGPEWSPPARPSGEAPPQAGAPGGGRAPGEPRPAEAGDPPIARPLGERSRHGGRLPESDA